MKTLRLLPLFLACAATGSARAAELKRWPAPDRPGHARAVQVDDRPLLFLTQIAAWDAAGRASGDAAAQAAKALDHLQTALTTAGATAADVVQLNFYVSDDAHSAALDAALARGFGANPIAATFVRSKLVTPGALLALDAIVALAPRRERSAQLSVPGWPAALTGAHAAVLPAGAKTFVAGQADTTANVDFRSSVRRTLAGLDRTLTHLLLAKRDIVQVKTFFKPFENHGEVAEEVSVFFADAPVPPLAMVEFRAGVAIEIEFVVAGAGAPLASDERLRFSSVPWLPVLPQFSRAVAVNAGVPLIFLEGLYGHPGSGGTEETKDIFADLGALLFDVGASYRTLVKGTTYTAADYGSTAFRDIRLVYYDPACPPASSSMGAAGTGRPGRTITLQMIAAPRPQSAP